ncbi:hypothetical protein BDQ17DRAFT_1368607 [Cyathus striatus]|nr:hypothetical protein BDQ17DRAFT_1368607 [Cyathus striatus]
MSVSNSYSTSPASMDPFPFTVNEIIEKLVYFQELSHRLDVETESENPAFQNFQEFPQLREGLRKQIYEAEKFYSEASTSYEHKSKQSERAARVIRGMWDDMEATGISETPDDRFKVPQPPTIRKLGGDPWFKVVGFTMEQRQKNFTIAFTDVRPNDRVGVEELESMLYSCSYIYLDNAEEL